MDNPERAREAALKLPQETSVAIVQLGQERLKALQASGTALDARTAQSASIQLAAAAFAGGLIATKDISISVAVLGFLACAAFVIGAAIAFYGITSCHAQVAGIEPEWWFPATEDPEFDEATGRSWAARTTQDMIDFTRNVDERRARYLNRGVFHGISGVILVLLAAFVRLWSLKA